MGKPNKPMTIYDAPIAQLNHELTMARARYELFIGPIRKKREALRQQRYRAIRDGDMTKFVNSITLANVAPAPLSSVEVSPNPTALPVTPLDHDAGLPEINEASEQDMQEYLDNLPDMPEPSN